MDTLRLRLLLGRAALSAARLCGVLQALGCEQPDLGAIDALLGRSRAALHALGLPPHACKLLESPPTALLDADAAWVMRERIALLDIGDPRYPPLLRAVHDAPALLYVRGATEALGRAQLAVVGTRQPTGAGRQLARDFAARLARQGLTITSGLAFGIDAASHEGALAGAIASVPCTLAVVGTGLDRIYPLEHVTLAQRIATHGALVSEFPPGTAPRTANFPRRNRLLAALSLGTLVIEAEEHSGALLAARHAQRYGRSVFAVPGAIDNPLARGCHALLRGGATLVEGIDDILAKLKIPYENQEPEITSIGPANRVARPGLLDKAAKILLDALGFAPASVDSLVERTGFPSQSVASMLVILELEGIVEAQAGGQYARLPSR